MTEHGQETILDVSGVRVRFGGISALNVEEMRIPRSQIVGVVGANGAGKTTLLDVISGFVKSSGGSVLFEGRTDLLRLRPEARAKLGIIRSFQSADLFTSMTVYQTVATACHKQIGIPGLLGSIAGGPWSRAKDRRIRDEAEAIIDRMGLERYYDKFISELSTGTRRIVDLACAVAQRPRVLLLDEPGSGIAQSETAALGKLIVHIRDSLDCTLVVIEHDIPLLRNISDVMYVLEVGEVIVLGDQIPC